MRLLRRLMALLLITGGIGVVTIPPAAAWTCDGMWLDDGNFRVTVCVDWDASKGGASISSPRSTWTKDYTTGASSSLLLTGTLKDTKANGKCAYLRVKRTNSALNFNEINEKACKKGTTVELDRRFVGSNYTTGKYTVLLCNGKKKKTCKAIFNQVVS